MFAHAVEIAAAGRHGQDRAVALDRGTALMIALADGAGGTGNGALAAQAIVDAVVGLDGNERDARVLLAQLDTHLARLGGQSTAVIVAIDGTGLRGASVGDSGAWVVHGDEIVDLTDRQVRKPLVGDGCVPVAFQAASLRGGTLIVASDGLFRYAKRDEIVRLVHNVDLHAAAHALVALVRLPNGGLQDDVAIVLCRELQ
jgi:serine/threonine protein phosphatase PrpC